MRAGIFWAFTLFFCNAFSADYLLYEENGKFGVKDQSGKIVINAAFEGLGWSDGSFTVIGQVTGFKSNNRWGLINLKGEKITQATYLSLQPSGGDRFIVKKEIDAIHTKVGCIDLKGDITIPLKYDGIKITGLRAIVFTKEGTRFNYGITNLNGEVIIPIEYRNIFAIGDMRYAVQNIENKYSLFSENGNQLTPFAIDSVASFIKSKAIIYEGFKKGVINREGVIEVTPQYSEISFSGEIIKAKTTNRWLVLDNKNQIIQNTECDELTPSTSGFMAQMANRFGVLNNEFKPLVPTLYNSVEECGDHIIAKLKNKFGLIDKNNNVIIPFNFDSLLVNNRFVRAKEKILGKNSWSLYDTYGIKKSSRDYEFIYPFNGKYFLVKNYGLYGVMDQYGKEIVHCLYDSVLASDADHLSVKFHGHYGVIDYRENWVLPPQSLPLQLGDEFHYFLKEHDTWLFKNFEGDLIYFTNNSIELIRDKHVLREVLPDGTEKEISLQGITLSRTTPPKIEDAEIVSGEHEGLRGIRKNGKYGFIDSEGRLRIANRYERIGNFNDGLAAVMILGKWGFVDKQDHIVINPSYEWVSEFVSDIAIVRKGKMGLINQTGEVVLETRYDNIEKLETGTFLLHQNNLLGLASEKGEILIDPRFDTLQDLGNGMVLVSRDKKFGLLSENGLSLIPMIYDHMVFLRSSGHFLAKQESPWIEIGSN